MRKEYYTLLKSIILFWFFEERKLYSKLPEYSAKKRNFRISEFLLFPLRQQTFKMSTKGGKVGQNTSPRGDRTETGLRTKPSAEQLQPGAYSDLYRTCRLRITGKHLASSWRVCVCVCLCLCLCARACVCACFSLSLHVSCVRACFSLCLYVSLCFFILSVYLYSMHLSRSCCFPAEKKTRPIPPPDAGEPWNGLHILTTSGYVLLTWACPDILASQ